MEDNQIVELYHKRDEIAISETQQKYGLFCHRIAINILTLQEDAEECVNDTYLSAWKSMPPAFPNSLKAFLGRITRTHSIDRYRANHAKKRYNGVEMLLSELEDCVPTVNNVEIEMERMMLTEIINTWLDSLSPDDCTLFVRRYWFGDAVKTLAKTCGCTQNQMAQRMLKLRKSLKEALELEGVVI
ncbi:MAG: sigma-70 family RNA polymerase sigma factor [Ruminococcaceae bacterium]|nr:sigma-70 family RNA polymerase sigma factor [Oscillospiraceae bacterium]